MPRQIIQVPEGLVAGEPLYVVLATGETVQVNLPKTATPGDQYAVEYNSGHLGTGTQMRRNLRLQRTLVDISDSARAAKSVYPVVKAVMLGAVPKDASCVVEVPPRAPPPNAPPGESFGKSPSVLWRK
eukprot:scaffold686_cov234-Pinguiococcus_pyrenoidosus.AAC.5